LRKEAEEPLPVLHAGTLGYLENLKSLMELEEIEIEIN
jgi:hypothetical protein